ncbi:hypothetical protein DFH11DRAFT_207302 [Phellopilus nigrolimitatus]|nr:hypothetical protein DFH11DRAFT_207302 [Phellopilus nigrolimitatus]
MAVRKSVFELPKSTRKVASYPHKIAHDWTQRLASRSRLPADLSATVEDGPERVCTVRAFEPKELMSADLDCYLQGEDVNYIPLPNICLQPHHDPARLVHGHARRESLFPSSALAEYPLALSAGLEEWKGFSATVCPAYGILIVDMNVCTGSFYVQSARLSDAMTKHRRAFYESTSTRDVGCTTCLRNPYILFRADFTRGYLGVGYKIRG